MATLTVSAFTYSQDTSFGSRSWSGAAANIQTSNNTYVSVDTASSANSWVILVVPASLSSIPEGSIINGIRVRIERKAAAGTANEITALLYKTGVGYVGTDKSTGASLPASDTIATFGGTSDLWGTTWTRDEVVTNLRFGYQVDLGVNSQCDVDWVEFTITYTAPLLFSGSITGTIGGSTVLRGLNEFSGQVPGAVEGSALIAGGTAEFEGENIGVFDGDADVVSIAPFESEAAGTFDGYADIQFNFSFKWSIEHLEARTDYGFPTVWVEIDNTALPGGAFPEGSFYERRLLEVPRLDEAELDSRFGISGFQRVTLTVDNSDGLLSGLNVQDSYVRMFFVDAEGAVYREFKGKVTEWTLSHRCVLNVEDVDAIAITQDLPRRTVNVLVEAEKTADANFEDVVVANDLGNPIPVIFGRAVKAPLLYVKADETNREYDYIIGEGEGLGGNNFQDVFTVYRNDQALDDIEGNAQSGSSASALKLESGDQRPGSWYKYWWVEITSGPGAGSIRHVTNYDAATNIITPNSNFSAALTTSSHYRLREWRFFDGSQASPYPAYAFIRFKKRMGVSGSTDPIYADVNGFGDETNVVRAVQSLLSNADWGLGLDVDAASFDAAAGIAAVSAMLCEGAVTETAAAVDVLNELLGFRDMVLSKDNEIRISVDQAKTSGFNFGLGHETGWNNILTASPEVLHIHPNEKVKILKTRYRKNYRENDLYQYELERQSSANGVDKTVNLPFVYDHATADRWLDYKRKRYAAAVKRMSLEVGQDGRDAARGELASVSIPSLGMNAQGWEIAGSGVTPAGANSLSLVPYSAAPYTYVPVTSEGGTLPVDESFDITPDYTKSIPDPVTGVSVTMSMGIVGFTAHPFALITWTPPEDNYGGAVVSVKLHSDATTLFRTVGTYTTSARIEGLVPGQLYDFLVESLNVTGELKGLGVTVNNSGAGYIAGGDNTAPTTPTGLDGEAKHGMLVWWWNKSPEGDVSHYEYEIYSAAAGGNLLVKKVLPHLNDSNFKPTVQYQRQRGDLTSQLTGALRVRAKDHSGNPTDPNAGWTSRFALNTGAVKQQDVTTSEIQLLGQDSSDSTNLSVTVTTRGKLVDLAVSWVQTRDAGVILTIRRDTSTNLVVHSWGPLDQACHAGAQSFFYRDSPSAGSHTYEVLFGNGAFSTDRRLAVKENRNG